jgi:uncharacterized protein YegL
VALNLILVLFISLGLWNIPFVSAETLDHTVGNLDITELTDYGRFGTRPLEWNGVKQTAGWGKSDSYTGLVFDQSLYDHSGGDYGIADWWDSMEIPIFPDFNRTKSDSVIEFDEDTLSLQKSTCSFTQVDAYAEIGVSYDARFHQTVWTLAGKDWAILEWRVENLRTSALTSVNLGLEIFSSAQSGQNWFGPGGDNADDLDFWDAASGTYYVQDDSLVSIGYASADSGNQFDHYYGDTVNFFDVDKDAYNALTAADQLAKDSGFTLGTDPIYSLVSWNNRVISAGSSEVFAIVIACGSDSSSMLTAVSEARDFWESTRLRITEIQDSPNVEERIEIHNSGDLAVDLSGYYLTPDDGLTRWSLDSLGSIPSQSYEVYSTNPGQDNLGDEGGEISLYDAQDFILDRVGYGTSGKATDPLSGESTARYHDGNRYNQHFTREDVPTFGSPNTVLDKETGQKVVLNEVLFNPITRDAFIELKYIGFGAPVPLLGWKIVVDEEYIIGAITLDLQYRYFVIDDTQTPSLFASLTATGDNVYLYNTTGSLVDMVGWSSASLPDYSLARVPEGYGTYDGYDDTSSERAGWQFLSEPTMALVNIVEDDQDSADLGDTITFHLNISNAGNSPDVVDVNYTSLVDGLPGWWTVSLLFDGSFLPLTDTDGDGIVDVGILAPQTYITIIVEVTVPGALPIGGFCEIKVEVFSSNNPFAYDHSTLTAGSYPHIEAQKSADPTVLYLEGGSAFGFSPDSTILTINLTGKGWIPGTQISQDVMFCMDRSSSMQSSDPSRERVAGAQYYTDLLDLPARAGVVEFNETARMLQELTDDYGAVKGQLGAIGADGFTDMSLGLMISIDELIENGNYFHNRVIILLTDGQNNYAWQDDATIDQANRARDNGIIIFTIGLGDLADEPLLQQIAAITGGNYYFSPTPDNLRDIFGYIAEELIVIAGHDPDPSDSLPMLTDVLPPYISYVPGTFVDPETGDPRDPTRITIDGFGNTHLEWNISQIAIGQTWQVSFEISSDTVGLLESNVFGISSVNYTRFIDANTTISTNDTLPRVWLNILPLPPLPPTLYCNLTANKEEVWLNWTQPPTPTDHYLIYRSEDKQTFDFSLPWKDTSLDVNPTTGILDPLNRNWVDLDAALFSAPSQYYYIVRSVEASGNISTTSNTVGKWTKLFDIGMSSFSLPLQPFEQKEVDWYCDEIPNVEYIKWADPTTQTWVMHLKSDPLGVNDATVLLSEGYEIRVTSQTYYTFTGRPGTSIRYDEDYLPAPSGFSVSLGPIADIPQSSQFGADWYGTTDIAAGDFNNDGKIDVIESNMNFFNALYLGDGLGNFGMPYTFGGMMDMAMCIAAGDVNNDTFLDAVVGYAFLRGYVYLGNGDGTFGASFPFGNDTDIAVGLALGDVNNDDKLDIVRGNNGGMNEVFLGDGDGSFDTTSFTFGTGSDQSWGIALGDVDGNSDLDIICGNYGGQNAVYLGDGTGGFATSIDFGPASGATSSVAAADVNNDYDIDIVIGNIGEQNEVYIGDGDGTFDTTSYSFGEPDDYTYKVVVGDLDEDLNLDIVLGNEHDGTDARNFVYLGDGSGDYTVSYEYGPGDDPTRGVALGDINSDDRLDIIAGNLNQQNYGFYWIEKYTVDLIWNSVSDPQFDRYLIYRSDSRYGLNLLSLGEISSTQNTFFSDMVDIRDGANFYYMVAAVSATDIIAYNTTYSIGVWLSDYDEGYGSFALPLEPVVGQSADWYCNDINNSVGINYHIYNEQRWSWHATRMPAGAYDPVLEMAAGYQLSTSDETRYVFIGI